MDEYTCKKCNEACEIVWGLNNKPYWPDCYCDTCQDEARGFDADAYSADWLAERTDRGYDRAKYGDLWETT